MKGFKLSNIDVKKLLTHEFMNVVVADVEKNRIVKNGKLCKEEIWLYV